MNKIQLLKKATEDLAEAILKKRKIENQFLIDAANANAEIGIVAARIATLVDWMEEGGG
jgi:hypothetical protein